MGGDAMVISLIPVWSGTNASLGGLSGSVVEVTHPPDQPGGRAGGVTPSKFCTHAPGLGVGDALGVGEGVNPGEDVGDGVGDGVNPGEDVGDGVGVPGVGVGEGVPFPRSYTSTTPMPVPLFRPASRAV